LDLPTIIVSIGGAAAAAWIAARLSVKHAQKLFSTENSKAEIIKAIELAEVYAKEIIPSVTRICEVYESSPELFELLKRLHNFRKQNDLRFTRAESLTFFKKDELNSATKILNRISNEKGIIREKNVLLNRLEYFSMYFNTNTADHDTVYQSLHQSYFSIVIWMYFDISSRNKAPKDHYFTNIITLFNTWNNIYLSQEAAEISVLADHLDSMDAVSDYTESKLENIKRKPKPYKK
jgi:hypothetical protein